LDSHGKRQPALIDDACRENAKALLASLNMLIETVDGFEYTPLNAFAGSGIRL
jgi:hypothetical protein